MLELRNRQNMTGMET